MKKVFLFMVVSIVALSSQASNVAEDCFALSLDGKKISHIVQYILDFDNQVDVGPVPKIHVRVTDFLDNSITGTTLNQPIVNDLKANPYSYGKYPAKHHIAFTQIKLGGQKVNYDVTVDGVAQEIGSGMTIVRGHSKALIDGKETAFPNLMTVRWCPNPADREGLKEVESLL